MLMDGLVWNGNREVSAGRLDTLNTFFLNALELILLIIHVSNNIFFILLFIYKRPRKPENPGGSENVHAPIFRELYNLSFLCVIFDDICLFTSILGNEKNEASGFIFLIMMLVESSLGSFLLSCIVLLSLLAFLQRFLIIYIPTFKWILAGNSLKRAMILLHTVMIHYCWVSTRCDAVHNNRHYCRNEEYENQFFVYNLVFLFFTFITGAFYYHLFKIMKNMENIAARSALLNQFIPVFFVQLIYVLFFVISMLISRMYTNSGINKLFDHVTISLTTIFPIIISISYIKTRFDFKTVILSVFRANRSEVSPT
ncbi:Serpentine Receptor, class Z [Caenorhabditis elegans]|uniref:Serpentine Receptor, class Z n=1 Tax=Caenorhabditis elegans TaxID=6239 RepID=Q9U318_CAEEL|nr:Serpentine Receptor, class Z [Caenorhabditis elegans]CAB60310.4 Serpentine Receptor, class Z [Caenorhabditis elegans]|eukprot:NP_502890.4 Uncharacterized protein CELE_Y105C5B.1 [Caenorhabditis elegans]